MEKRNGTPWLRAALALPAALLVGAAPALAQETETETETETMDYTTETAQQCTLNVVPPVVAVGEEPVTVVASLSDSVGTVTTAGADSESGLVLSLATDGAQGMAHAEEGMDQTEDVAAAGEDTEKAAEDVAGEAAYGQDQAELGYDYGAQQGAATVNLELDTSAAQVGQWQIWVEGAEGTCEGTLEVAEQGQTDMGLEETPQVDPYETDTEEPQTEPFPQDEPVQDEPLN